MNHRGRQAAHRWEDSFKQFRCRGYMPKHGKKFRDAAARVPEGETFGPTEAVSLVKDLSFAKFDETVELAVRLGVDPRHADQIVRGAVVLPH
jgi:large subunit ribosomal protein L1